MELNSYEVLVMRRRLPDPRMLRVVSRSLFLVLVLVTLLWNGIIRRASSSDSYADNVGEFGLVSDRIDARFLDVIFQDLCNEGLVRKGDKAVVVTSRVGAVIGDSRMLNADEGDLVLESDLARGSALPNETFDFAIYLGLEDVRSVDRVVKVGGIVVSQFGRAGLPLRQPNYRVVFLWLSSINKLTLQQREGCHHESSWQNWEGGLRQGYNLLPELLVNSLEGYQRRVFVEVGSHENKKGSKLEWFKENCPICASNWLIKNAIDGRRRVVVMKAKAEVVEEMIESKCKNQWQNS